MSLITRPLPALFNGVSQQPATLRLPSQAAAQVNCHATVVDGLMKRPAFHHVSRISNEDLVTQSAFIHTINRDTTERYSVVVTNGTIKVYDIDGTEQTVNFPVGVGYLTSTDPQNEFAMVSIADYTFVINKTVDVATMQLPNTLPADFYDWYVPPGWKGVIEDDYKSFPYTDKGVKQTFTDLPKTTDTSPKVPPAENDLWKIAGFDEDSFGSYYVIRRGGVWEECHAPGTSKTLDPDTMPHVLVREADGTFVFTKLPWSRRRFGDDVSNPEASFVGTALKDIFYYRNRLGVVSGENVVFSCASDYANFWRNTVTTLLDADVVDVAISSQKVSELQFAVPFDNRLMLFSDQTQFALNVDELLTPASVSIDIITEYEMAPKVRPIGVGTDLYFVTEAGRYSRIREYFVQKDANSTSANDTSAHVPRYIPSNVQKITGNTNEDVLFAFSPNEPNRVYVYKFFWTEQGKTQASWSYWELADTDVILDIETLDSQLFILIQRADGVYLERCNIQSGEETGGLGFPVLLDRLIELPVGVYSAPNDRTSFTLPYPVPAAEQENFKIIRGLNTGPYVPWHESGTYVPPGGEESREGSQIDTGRYVWISETEVQVLGNESAGDHFFGSTYTSEWELSEQFVMNQDVAITTGRLQIRTFTVYFTDTAYFKVKIDPYGIDPAIQEFVPAGGAIFAGKTLGLASLTLGNPVFRTDRATFQIYGNSKIAKVSLINDTHTPSNFQSAEWEGFYFNRARPI